MENRTTISRMIATIRSLLNIVADNDEIIGWIV